MISVQPILDKYYENNRHLSSVHDRAVHSNHMPGAKLVRLDQQRQDITWHGALEKIYHFGDQSIQLAWLP